MAMTAKRNPVEVSRARQPISHALISDFFTHTECSLTWEGEIGVARSNMANLIIRSGPAVAALIMYVR